MLANEALLPVERLREAIRVDEAGVLWWLERPLSHFPRDKERRRWNARYAGTEALGVVTKDGHKRGCIDSMKWFWAARVVWALTHGGWPDGIIDHLDGQAGDNRPGNLRDVPELLNFRNQKRRTSNTSGVMGVTWRKDRDRWLVRINHDGGRTIVGLFRTFEGAVAARKAAERKLGYHQNHGR